MADVVSAGMVGDVASSARIIGHVVSSAGTAGMMFLLRGPLERILLSSGTVAGDDYSAGTFWDAISSV